MRTATCTPLAAIGLVAAPAAHADGHQDWHDPGHYDHGASHGRYDHGGSNAAAGALIGLGVGALIGGAIAASQKP